MTETSTGHVLLTDDELADAILNLAKQDLEDQPPLIELGEDAPPELQRLAIALEAMRLAIQQGSFGVLLAGSEAAAKMAESAENHRRILTIAGERLGLHDLALAHADAVLADLLALQGSKVPSPASPDVVALGRRYPRAGVLRANFAETRWDADELARALDRVLLPSQPGEPSRAERRSAQADRRLQGRQVGREGRAGPDKKAARKRQKHARRKNR